MSNERLRRAMVAAQVSVGDLSEAAQVDPKTVQRWLKGRVPHARHRWAAAKLLHEDEAVLWPGTDSVLSPGGTATSEVIAAYPHRANVPVEGWWELFVAANRQIDLLGYAMLHIPEMHPRLNDLLRGKSAAGCGVRILLVDPTSSPAAERDTEEGLAGGLLARIRTSSKYFGQLADCEGIDIHYYRAPLYNSVFRFDDEMFVTPHLHGTPGSRAPLLHLRRLGSGGIFDQFAHHFEGVWATSAPAELPQ